MFTKVKSYVQDTVELAKLESIEKVGKIVANIAYIVLIALFAFFLILVGSFAAGYWISTQYDDVYIGFLFVTGFYLLLLILFLIFKKQFINFVINMAIAASSKND